jgi:hypothetical protein
MDKRFLNKLKKEGKIKIVEPSVNISEAYLVKSENCLRSAKILVDNELYENSITESYYSMYNSALSLLFRFGIKSENHALSIQLLKDLFSLEDSSEKLQNAKKERIDKQYYISEKVSRDLAEAMVKDSEQVINEVKAYLNKIISSDIDKKVIEFEALLK